MAIKRGSKEHSELPHVHTEQLYDEELKEDRERREKYEQELKDSQAEINRQVKAAVAEGQAYDDDKIKKLEEEKRAKMEKYKKYYDWKA